MDLTGPVRPSSFLKGPIPPVFSHLFLYQKIHEERLNGIFDRVRFFCRNFEDLKIQKPFYHSFKANSWKTMKSHEQIFHPPKDNSWKVMKSHEQIFHPVKDNSWKMMKSHEQICPTP